MTNQERYAELVRAFLGQPGVSQDGKGFGASALKARGSIFAMLSSRGEFVVKLPAKRVDQLVAAGEGSHFDAGKGRPMKEWLALAAASRLEWAPLAAEAQEFVASRRRG